MIVVDASVAIDLVLGGESEGGDTMARHLRDRDVVVAPHLIDAEVGQGLRRFSLRSEIDPPTAESLVVEFLSLPVSRYPHTVLLPRAFELRHNVTVYDGLYLALAEALGCVLVTGDIALDAVPGCTADVHVVATTA